jgi:hypothetical protein
VSRRDHIALWVGAAAVLAARVPFLSAGYGLDPDAWRVVHAARHIADTGSYEASRLPGYPLQELTYSLLAQSGPVPFNAITALFSVAAFALFASIARHHGVRRWILVGLAFAFTPIVFIHGTTAMDYLWALAFVLGAYLAALHRRPTLAGALLGAAIGCRLTSSALFVPIAIVLWPHGGWRSAARAGSAAFAVALAAFSPVLRKYGLGFFAYYDDLGYPTSREVVTRATTEVWGTVGFAAIAIGFVLAMWTRRSRAARHELAAWAAAVVLIILAYLRLPHEAAYLIPAVPFVLLLGATALPDRAVVAGCAALIAAPFVSAGFGWVGRGEVLKHHAERVESLREAEAIIARAAALPEPSLVIVGPHLPVFQVLIGDRAGHARFVYAAKAGDLRRARAAGELVYVLPGQREHNRVLTGADPASVGAALLTPAGPGRLW